MFQNLWDISRLTNVITNLLLSTAQKQTLEKVYKLFFQWYACPARRCTSYRYDGLKVLDLMLWQLFFCHIYKTCWNQNIPKNYSEQDRKVFVIIWPIFKLVSAIFHNYLKLPWFTCNDHYFLFWCFSDFVSDGFYRLFPSYPDQNGLDKKTNQWQKKRMGEDFSHFLQKMSYVWLFALHSLQVNPVTNEAQMESGGLFCSAEDAR